MTRHRNQERYVALMQGLSIKPLTRRLAPASAPALRWENAPLVVGAARLQCSWGPAGMRWSRGATDEKIE